MPLRTLIGLILCNLIWAINPAASKVLLRAFDPLTVAWLRYASCLAAYLVATRVMLRFPRREPWSRLRFDHAFMTLGKGTQRSRDFRLVLIGGILTFCVSPILQVSGLNVSRAIDNVLIIALEPLVTLLLARLFLGERLHVSLALSFAAAILGFGMLSGVSSWDSLSGIGVGTHLFGNLLILASLVGEGSYSIYGRKLMVRHPANEVFGSAVAIGVAALTWVHWGVVDGQGLGQLLSPEAWNAASIVAVLWIGPLGTAFTYLYWIFALESLSVGSLALTLFIQPMLGAAFGSVFLGEYLTGIQWIGGGLILLSVLSQLWVQGRNRC